MKTEEELTFSQNKTKLTIYRLIGRKISESRKSSRRKLEGISKKLNINIEILKKIESGEIETIEKEIGKKAIKIFQPIQAGDVTSTYADITKLKNWIGYNPTTSVEKGVIKFIEWYRKLSLIHI